MTINILTQKMTIVNPKKYNLANFEMQNATLIQQNNLFKMF